MKKASRAHPERGRTALRRVVLPGFEPGQAEPKTAVLPLHHKTILSIRKPSESAERSQRLCISDCKINAIFSHNQILCKNFSFSLQSWGDAYSQLATAKLVILRKKTVFGDSKLSFFRGLRLILY